MRWDCPPPSAPPDPDAALTPRERQVLVFVVTGQPNKQVAAALELSEMTVKVHRGQIMRKMRATSLATSFCAPAGPRSSGFGAVLPSST